MARPSLGAQARSQPVTVRLTAKEKQELTKAYGTPSRGLRHLINEWAENKK